MTEVIGTFSSTEAWQEGTNRSPKTRNGSPGCLAQKRFELAEGHLDGIGARWALRELKRAALIGDRVVAGDNAVLLDAQDVDEACGIGRHEGALGDLRRHRELVVVERQINLADVAVGGRDVVDAEQAQLLRQPALERAEHTLAAAARLRRIGRDMLNAKPCQRPTDLGQPFFVDRLAGRRCEEIMAAAVGVEARWEAPGGGHFEKRTKRRNGPFLLYQKFRGK